MLQPDTATEVAKTQENKVESYIGCKIIRGEKMTRDDFSRQRGQIIDNNLENEEGYKVYYPDGYVSWSPKKVFEQAYRKISTEEIELLNRTYEEPSRGQ